MRESLSHDVSVHLANRTTAALRELSNLKQILYVLSKIDEQVMHNFYE